MSAFDDMVRRIERLESGLNDASKTIRFLTSRLVGGGVIENSGNRLKIDVSCALSEFARKSDLPAAAQEQDLSRYARKNDLRRLAAAAVTSKNQTGGTGSAGAGKQYVAMTAPDGTTYKLLHDGSV